jgi:hypothetical protein
MLPLTSPIVLFLDHHQNNWLFIAILNRYNPLQQGIHPRINQSLKSRTDTDAMFYTTYKLLQILEKTSDRVPIVNLQLSLPQKTSWKYLQNDTNTEIKVEN